MRSDSIIDYKFLNRSTAFLLPSLQQGKTAPTAYMESEAFDQSLHWHMLIRACFNTENRHDYHVIVLY